MRRTPGSFFDTNVLIYLASVDDRKADRALDLVAQGGTVSVQVLNEIANVLRRKSKMSWEEIRTFLAGLRGLLSARALDVETHETGMELAERYRLSVYDAIIVASALAAGCDTLWTEDMQDGLLIGNRLRITNPFR